ncbi:Lcl3p Ecym_2228 [Eremothecium cymbalariae DBVPG|uniref:Probable endonuclease LCL3 n=1 Tax=Eremothecium cymbalariae (strain CBS 270.75 / DBVPG 7215 / KCTC 17166 / NRRL Y-17582) TaxID=931890 RepID=G8JP71_ERECY|nr:Hypothetical protein Ecym_2228 [Eremothecium cymbalariae DBVPG\
MTEQKKSSVIPFQSQVKLLVLPLLITGGLFTTYVFYNRHLRQYTGARDIPSHLFRRGYLFGKVTSVGDGDNFHFFHMPGGILGGWHWLREVPSLPRMPKHLQSSQVTTVSNSWWSNWLYELSTYKVGRNKRYFKSLHVPYRGKRNLPTISVRLCGVDAPEGAHFGKSAQPLSEEALIWLRYTILGKYVGKPLAIDHYGRCVAKVEYLSWLKWKNVSLEMIKQGLGVVYEGKLGAEFDSEEPLYRYHEAQAKKAKKGVWGLRRFETPATFKKRTK